MWDASPPRAISVIRRYGTFVVAFLVICAFDVLDPSISAPVALPAVHGRVGPLPVFQSAGVTVGGVPCGPGIRQVPWSAYAPYCTPAWHGSNGGATAPGVTGKTITITYRQASSAETAGFYLLVPQAVFGTNSQAEAMLQAYVAEFNKTFELYGRQVVLQPFSGSGDFISEVNGQNVPQTQADAAAAHSLGAFADLSLVGATPQYDLALAQQHILSFTPFSVSSTELAANAPYEYSIVADCTKVAAADAEIVGRSLSRTPVSFAADPKLDGRARKFGVILQESPDAVTCGQELKADLAAQGVTLAQSVELSFDPSTVLQQIGNAVGQLKAAGVTSVLCAACDFVSPILVTRQAQTENYGPEWITTDYNDAFARLPTQSEWEHAIATGTPSLAPDRTEAYQVFKMADPQGQVISSFQFIYSSLLMLFRALQQAGPDLTAQSFQTGFRSLPPSLPTLNGSPAMFGSWQLSGTSYDPQADFELLWWSPTTPSLLDGQPGSWQPCNSGSHYSFSPDGAEVPVGAALQCGPPP